MYMKNKGPRVAKTFLEKKDNIGGPILRDMKTNINL